MHHADRKPINYLDYLNPQKLVEENQFRQAIPTTAAIPAFSQIRNKLPQPYWHGREDAIACWWKVWELGWGNITLPTAENHFIAPYIDTAYNGNLFLWDSVFALMFARYGRRLFNFQQTLDNFYATQRADGFICRELRPQHGGLFHPHDPASTGPNLFAWSEWDHYKNTGDLDRLGRVFPPILAYHRWLRTHRTWQDGSYFHSGLASGMDNQPVDDTGAQFVQVEHRHLSRIDATAQALLSAQTLCHIAAELNRTHLTQPEQQEITRLKQLINTHNWDDDTHFYHHWHPETGRTTPKSIGAFWTLLSDTVPTGRLTPFLSSLSDPATFNRPHRIPSLAHDNQFYQPIGDYWRGGVWPPTNYMTLRGLSHVGRHDLAHEIACNHHDNVVQVFNETGTVWEFYAPETITYGLQQDGTPAVTDFVGWSGLAPVALLLEYRFGLRPDAPHNRLTWDIRETSSTFGVTNYPFGRDGLLDLHHTLAPNPTDQPTIQIKSNIPLQLDLHWPHGQTTLHITPE